MTKDLLGLSLKFQNQKLFVLDQRLLPQRENWHQVRDPQHMIELIQSLAVRGAPLIGIAAALSAAQYCAEGATQAQVLTALNQLLQSRPTAVNLMHCIDRMSLAAEKNCQAESLLSTAQELFEEDVRLCEAMAEGCQAFIKDGDQILTHCNTGGLATAGIGTALGAIRRAHELGKKIHVYVDETRPLYQGARLTAWELENLGIPYTLICDNMAGALMAQGKISKVFVGADRIAKNGDVANKIGTYSLAVLAHFHKVPFYVVAPDTTYDPACGSGDLIPIEQRDPEEVRQNKSPLNAKVYNPAFDVTPNKLISHIILNNRII